jgi:hypothetical protein
MSVLGGYSTGCELGTENEQRDSFQMSNVSFEQLKSDGSGKRWATRFGTTEATSLPFFSASTPDLNNHFPWDEGFDASWRNRQPLLFQHPLNPTVEIDFWAATIQPAVFTIGSSPIHLTQECLQQNAS